MEVDKQKLSGINYMGEQPLINCLEIEDENVREKCLEDEFLINQRVEFVFYFGGD